MVKLAVGLIALGVLATVVAIYKAVTSGGPVVTHDGPQSLKQFVEQQKPEERVSPAYAGLSFLDYVVGYAGLALGALALASVGVLAAQVYWWLKNGTWYPMPLSKLLEEAHTPYPDLQWKGVQKIVDVVLDWPMTGTGIMIAMVGGIVLLTIEERIDDQRRTMRVKRPGSTL
jgi:hypothetical protein